MDLSFRNKLIKKRSSGFTKSDDDVDDSPCSVTSVASWESDGPENMNSTDISQCGYVDAVPDITKDEFDKGCVVIPSNTSSGHAPTFEPEDPSKYEYGDEASAEVTKTVPRDTAKDGGEFALKHIQHSTPRRSSMKGSSGPGRRSSISCKGEIMVTLPGQQEPVTKRQSIGFEKKVDVIMVEPVKNLSDNPKGLWFQADEYDRMRAKTIEIVKIVKLGMTEGKKFCIRGLEKLMKKDSLTRKYNAWDAVLGEQYSQKSMGTFDDSTIAEAYSRETRNCQEEARLRAQQDQREIERYSKRP